MSIELIRCSRFVFTLFSYPEYVWIMYQRRPVSTSSAVGAVGATGSGCASTSGTAGSGSASRIAPARRRTFFASSTETSSTGSAVPRNARAASAAASSESFAASTSSGVGSGSCSGGSEGGIVSFVVSSVVSSRSSLMTLPLWRGRRRRWDRLIQQDAVDDEREDLVRREDVRGDDRRDHDHEHGETDDGLAVRPGDLLQLGPGLLSEANDAPASGPDLWGRRSRRCGHQRTPARRERLELSTAGFGDQCSTS